MKYLKLYEELNDNLKVGDYVYANILDESDINSPTGAFLEYLENNYGILVPYRDNDTLEIKPYEELDKSRPIYVVQYFNIPVELRDDFGEYRLKDEIIRYCKFYRYEILFYSNDEDVMKSYMESKKYNL